MGAFLEKPNTDKHNETGEGNGLRFGVSSMQGECLQIKLSAFQVLKLLLDNRMAL
jgi:hypothetical protein